MARAMQRYALAILGCAVCAQASAQVHGADVAEGPALWQLELHDETIRIRDEATTDGADALPGRGIELNTHLELARWLAAHVDLTFAPPFDVAAGIVDPPVGAPELTWAVGLSAPLAFDRNAASGELRVSCTPASPIEGSVLATIYLD